MQIRQDSKQLFKNGYDTIYRSDALFMVGLQCHQQEKELCGGDYKILCNTENRSYTITAPSLIDSQSIRFDKSVELSSTFFYNLLFVEWIRGITNAMREILDHKKTNKAAQQIRQLFEEDIFANDLEKLENFYGVVNFIRNTFSHNIRDRLEIKLKDYNGQIKGLGKGKRKPEINFSFDPSHFQKRDIILIEINIDFNKIKDGMLYTNIIDFGKTLSFIVFCYDCVNYLKDKMDIQPSYKIIDSILGSY